jgi:hypothetical protein
VARLWLPALYLFLHQRHVPLDAQKKKIRAYMYTHSNTVWHRDLNVGCHFSVTFCTYTELRTTQTNAPLHSMGGSFWTFRQPSWSYSWVLKVLEIENS